MVGKLTKFIPKGTSPSFLHLKMIKVNKIDRIDTI